MNPIKTLAAASAIAVAVSSDLVSAWDASVTFYDNAQFSGDSLTVHISTSQKCFSIGCFNDRASSVHWDGIPAKNVLGNNMVIAFYTDKECGGADRRWASSDRHPEDFSRDGINDQVSSFMILETLPWATSGQHLVCPFMTAQESTLVSNSMVIDATEAAIQKANATASHSAN